MAEYETVEAGRDCYSENAGLLSAVIVDRHGFTNLCDISFEGYQDYVVENILSSEAEFISQRLESNRLTGGSRFVKETELRTGIRLKYRRSGQPPARKANN